MGKTSILIIDDDPEFVDYTKRILQEKQYRVNAACNADEGLARLEEEIPDAIILDIMMGMGAEGFIFARKIKKDPRTANIPVIVITSMSEQTGFVHPVDPMHPKFFPIDEYLEKPLEPQVLLDEVERLIAARRDN